MPALRRSEAGPLRGAKIEERAVIGDGAPFDAQLRGLGVQGWSQATALEQTRKTSPLRETPAGRKSCAPIPKQCDACEYNAENRLILGWSLNFIFVFDPYS